MIMKDDKIKELFSDFKPELSSSFEFMTKLQRNMEAVEIVKQHQAALKKRNRMAVAIAAVCGFAMGVILTLLFPLISDWVSTLSISLPYLHTGNLKFDFSYVAWLIVAGASVLTSVNAYEIAMAKLSVRQDPHRNESGMI